MDSKIGSQKSLRETALAEKLDEIVKIGSCNEERVEYDTVHGWRVISRNYPKLNRFLVFKTGEGFAEALALPYAQVPGSTSQVPRLIVYSVVSDVATAGYAKAVHLPYYIAGIKDDYPTGALVVCIDADNSAAIKVGYANALPRVALRNEVYIEDKRMLDTDYADSLVDFPRFGELA